MATAIRARFVLFVFAVSILALGAAAADTLELRPDRVVSGEPTTATLTLDRAPDKDTIYPISLSGKNSARAPTSIQVRAGERNARFSLTSAAAPGDEFVDIAVGEPGSAKKILASARLVVTPAVLASLTLDKSLSVGGTANNAVTGTVTLRGVAAAPGLTVLLGQACPNCVQGFQLDLPQSVQVPSGGRLASFTFEPRAVTSRKEFTILASLAGVTKTAVLEDDTLRPQAISVSPASISGAQQATVTVTLNAPAYEGYQVRISCSQPLVSILPPNIKTCFNPPPNDPKALRLLVPSGQTSVSQQVHNTQATSPTQVTIEAQGVGINGEVQTTLTVVP